jgi:ParB family chromosome partitioning protein
MSGKHAFNAKRKDVFLFDPNDLTVIGHDTDNGPDHPLYDARAKLPVDEKLVLNIMALGKVLEPISVRKNGDVAEVVWGRQRVKACREANKRLKAQGSEPVFVPAMVERAEDGQVMGLMISENEIRQEDSPMTRVRKIQRYIDHGHTEDEAAVIFGLTKQSIKMQLSLLDLDKSVQKMIESGRISATAATSFAALPREEQIKEAEKLVSSGNTTVNDVKTAVKKTRVKRSGGDAAEVIQAPSKRIIKRLLKLNSMYEEKDQLNADFVKGIRFAIGDLPAASTKGLTAMIAAASEKE